jgi:nitrate/nitrite transporter NarK
VWLQALIVVSAYVAYKGFDNYALFAHEQWGMSEVEVGAFTAKMQWVRPVAAVGAGLLADRLICSRVVVACFVMLLGTDLYFAIATPDPSATWILFANVLVTCAAMFGLRGIYFALFEEASVPTAVTGTAVGLVSVVGYTPDIFVALVAGVLVDRTPGLAGHQHFFWFLAAFAAVGLVATALFRRVVEAADKGAAAAA